MHDHHHDHNNISGKNLRFVFFLNLAFTIFEIIGGIYTNSIAIISDAIHDLGDTLSLGSAWYLENKSKQKADRNFSFGYARFSLLGALINCIILIIGAVFIIKEAIGRFLEPEHTHAEGMILFAIVGIVVNGYAAYKVSGGKTLNEKVVSWHLIEDVLGWVVVLIGGIVLFFNSEWYFIDPVLSILISLFILRGVVINLKKTLYLFLQGVPKDLDQVAIEKELLEIEHVESLHDTRIWSLEGQHHVFSSHLKLSKVSNFNEIAEVKRKAKQLLKKYHFTHYTIETEFDEEHCEIINEEK